MSDKLERQDDVAGDVESSEQEFDREMSAELDRITSKDAPGPENGKGAGMPVDSGGKPVAGKQDDGGAGTGDKKPPVDGKSGQDAEAAKRAKEDGEFLKALGFDEAEAKGVTPQELARLRKVHGNLDKKIRDAENKAEFFGRSNKELSGKYKAVQKAMQDLLAQQTPADRAKGIISKIDRSKVSPNVAKLLDDPDMVEFMGLFLPGVSVAAAEGGQGERAGGDPEGDREALRQQVAGRLESAAKVIEAAGYEGFRENIYRSDGFIAWITPIIEDEKRLARQVAPDEANPYRLSPTLAKWHSANPAAHIDILNRYKTYRAAQEEERKNAEQEQANADALRAHGGGQGIKPDAEDGWKDPLEMSNEEFQAHERKMLASRFK